MTGAEERDGHLCKVNGSLVPGGVYKGAHLRAHLCLRCGAVQWEARGLSRECNERGRYRMRFQEKGSVWLPPGQLPQWHKARLRPAPVPACVPAEGDVKTALEEIVALLEQEGEVAEKANALMEEADALYNKARALHTSLLTPVLQTAAKAIRSARAQGARKASQ